MSSDQTLTTITLPNDGSLYFNVARHLTVGCSGDDVSLVQYLLARAPDAEPYLTGANNFQLTGLCPIGVADVDGIWGPDTAAAMAWFEQACTNPPVYRDGAIDPLGSVPYGDQQVFINSGGAYFFKLSVLQDLYVIAQSKAIVTDTGTRNSTLRKMAADGQCPSTLASNPLLAAEATV